MANKQLDSSGEPDKMLKAASQEDREQQEKDPSDECGCGGIIGHLYTCAFSVIITPDPPDVPGCAWCVSQPVSPNHDPYCSPECALMAAADDAGDD